LTSLARSGSRHDTVSPTLTREDALAGSVLRRIFPARHAAVAWDRLLKNRTAHSQMSNRISPV